MNTKMIELNQAQAILRWPIAEEYLRKALDFNHDQELLNIKARVMAGINTLWVIEDEEGAPIAYGVTYMYSPDGIIFTVQIRLATTTNFALEKFIEKLDEFEIWAHNQGAHYIEIAGRKGWEKIMKPHGFKHNYTSLMKRVTKELH